MWAVQSVPLPACRGCSGLTKKGTWALAHAQVGLTSLFDDSSPSQAVGATPESVMLLDSPAAGKEGTDEGAGAGALFLQVREWRVHGLRWMQWHHVCVQ